MKEKKGLTNIYELIFIVVDIVLILLAIHFSYVIKFLTFYPPRFNYEPFIKTSPFIIILYLILKYIYGSGDLIKQSVDEVIYSVFLIVLMLFISTTAVAYFMAGYSYPRTVILYSAVLQFILLSCWKSFLWKIKRKTYKKKDVLIIGNKNAEHAAIKILLKHRDLYNVKYISNFYEYSHIENLINKVEFVIICDDVPFECKDYVLDTCLIEQKDALVVPTMSDLVLIGSKLNKIDDLPLLKVKPLRLTIEQKAVKRILDLILSIIGTIIALPIIIITAIAIKVTDGGKVFYTQERVTEGGKYFNLIKFRSMKMNAERLSGPVLASDQDPRITKVGKIIRATRIDELPQLINILKGDMSIVGPRPERPFYVDRFEQDIPDYKYRKVVKAGLTGLAQILGKYNTTPEDKVKYDIMYIKNYSIILDLKLILQTIKIIFMKESTEGLKEKVSLEELIEKEHLDIKIYKKVD